MKILMIGEGMDIGGCETHIYELTRGLINEGHEVVLLSAKGRFATSLEEQGVRVEYAPTNKRTPFALIRSAFRIRRLLREHFDVVHTHTRGMSTLLHFLSRVAHTMTVHLDFSVGRWSRKLCRFGDSTLAVSEDIRDYLIREYGKKKEEIFLTYNGVDIAHFQSAKRGRHIVHLSRLDTDRSLCASLLCEIAPIILKEDEEREIHIFGDGNDMPRIQKMAQRANDLLGRMGVILHGKTEDIRAALSLGDIFVGVSRALLEAMASGRACIVCGNDGYGGILREDTIENLRQTNFCARGCEGASAKKLAVDLLYLIRHEEQRGVCASFCYDIANRFYQREGMVKDALHAYREAIQKTMKKTLLVGYFGKGNFGDEVALDRLLSLFHASKVYVSCKKKPDKRTVLQNVVFVSRLLGTVRALRRVRTVIFGGGTLFQNKTSNRSLLYYCLIARLAFLSGCNVIMLGGGVDTVEGDFAKYLTRHALNAFHILALRTEGDFRTVQKLEVKARCLFLPDLIFLEKERIRKKERRCALVVKNGVDENSVISLCQRCFSLGYDVTLALLFQGEDEGVCQRIRSQTGADLFSSEDIGEMLRFFAKCDFIISMRLHGGVSALLSHTLCFLYSGGEKQRKLILDVEKRAFSLGEKSPLLPFSSFDEITIEKILWAKKEAVGKTYGFEKINRFYRDKVLEGIMLLRERALPVQAFPSEPSSYLREQRHPQEPLLPWTSHERPQEPHAGVR